MPDQTDVLVVGAGPAGLSAAFELRALGRRVAVVERGGRQPYRLPETVVVHGPGAEEQAPGGWFRSFQSMAEPVAEIAFVDAAGTQRVCLRYAADPSRPPYLARLDRSRHDLAMRLAYEAAGNSILYSTTATAARFDRNGVDVVCRHPGGERGFRARLVVDASGKSHLLKGLLGLPAEEEVLDRRSSFFSHFELEVDIALLASPINLLPLEGGFIYAIGMGERRLSVGVTLFEEIPDAALTTAFWDRLAAVPWLHEILTGAARQILPVLKVQNLAFTLEDSASEGYVIVGDAGGFRDPFLGGGTEFALEAGRLAARYTQRVLDAADTAARAEAGEVYRQAVAALRADTAARLQAVLAASAWPLTPRHLTDPHLPYPLLSFLLGFSGRPGEAETRLRALRAELGERGGHAPH